MAGHQFRTILCVTLLVLVRKFWITVMKETTKKLNSTMNLLTHSPKSKCNSLTFLPTMLGCCMENMSVKVNPFYDNCKDNIKFIVRVMAIKIEYLVLCGVKTLRL